MLRIIVLLSAFTITFAFIAVNAYKLIKDVKVDDYDDYDADNPEDKQIVQKGGTAVKKTIIITIAMLCVFGGAVVFGAGKVATDWQHPNEDDVNISANSPVLQVENEFKIYNYITPESKDEKYKDLWSTNYPVYIQPQKDMLTYTQAASYGGTAIEKYLPHL